MAASCRSMLLLLLATVTAACATVPREVARADYCMFDMHRAEVPLPPAGLSPLFADAKPANALLLLSGGSQHGAFGAGVLARWKEINGGLPRFRTVTGISTGALLATDAFIDRPEAAEAAFRITDERQLLTPHARRTAKGGFTLGSYGRIIRNNAVADLAPLRSMLLEHITMGVLTEVVRRSSGRRLLVGAVDVDSGDAVVFDMLDMAKRAVEAPGARGEHFRNCYVEAIMASSSVPFAAPPVIIDNRMYIDGGARFGVFADGFGTAADIDDQRTPPGPPPDLFILVNGMERIDPQCGKADDACAPNDRDDYMKRDGAHARWDLLGLAKRSSDVLIAQIYRFSVADIMARYNARYNAPGRVRHLYIEPDRMLAHLYSGQSCAAWHEHDERTSRPLQFHPRYMACLIDYGRAFADVHSTALRIGHPEIPAGLRNLDQ